MSHKDWFGEAKLLCRRHRAVSVELLAQALGVERSWAQRCMTRLVAEGATGRHIHIEGRGRPRWVYGPRLRRKNSHTAHTLLRTQVIVNLSLACKNTPGVLLDYRLEHELPCRADPVPDAAAALVRGERASLFLIEIDRGTETICSSRNTTRDLVTKVMAYADFIDRRGFQVYADEFGAGIFGGLRMLLVTTSWARIHSLHQSLASRQGDFGFVWATTFAETTSEAILSQPIWKAMGESSKRALVAGTQSAQKAAAAHRAKALPGMVSEPIGSLPCIANNLQHHG